jgi:hypothetical protein
MINAMLPTGQMPEEVSQALERGERLLWMGAPQRGFKLRSADIYLIPFSLFWAGFTVFWESSVLQAANSPFFMKLWGIPFVLVGLYLVVGRFFVDARTREETVYAVTSQRALIFSGIFRREMKSLTLRNIPEVSVVKAYDGSGTISFGSTPPYSGLAGGIAGWPGSGRMLPPQFEMVDDVATVATLVREAQRNVLA